MIHPALALESSTTVAQAIDLLARYSGFAYVAIRRPSADGACEWFALPVRQFHWLLDGALAEESLEAALQLDDTPPSRTRDLNDGDHIDQSNCVVLDGDELVGVAAVEHRTTETHRTARPIPDAAASGANAPAERADPNLPKAIVPLLFATDRAMSEAGSRFRFFGSGRGPLSFGVAEVSIPASHERGGLESPTWWKLQFAPDPKRHVALLSVEPCSRENFVARGRDMLGAAPGDALVFVHGYNVSFENAARRTAQLAYDLRFRGIPLMYSWPSVSGTLNYFEDETNARWTVSDFREFLSLVQAGLGARAVHIVAHSMGNRVVTEALSGYHSPAGAAPLRQLVLAAPDIDADTFEGLSREFHSQAERVTLYASSEDLALAASKLVHGYPRAGDTRPHVVIVEGVDTIDASNVETDLLSHSYFGGATSILGSVLSLVEK